MKTESTERVLQFGARRISYTLHRADRKRLRVVVSPELKVDVFAPKSANDQQISVAMQKKTRWIVRTLDKLESFHPLPTPRRYVSGETFLYLGRQYRLKVVSGPSQPAKLLGRFLWVRIGEKNHSEKAKSDVDNWYRIRAFHTFRRYMDRWHPVAVRHGIPKPSLAIRMMRRRWGSCSSSGRITLNVNLVQMPVHCIEYVIMHELCHLVCHDHGPRFYSLLTRCQPDWRKRKQTLDQFRLC